MSKEILLSKGKVAIVDDEDFEWLNQWKWHYHHKGYAVRNIKINGEQALEHMHRVILNTPKGLETDHINHNGLDNRRCNLRNCTKSQNQANSLLRIDNSSGVKGVTSVANGWQASIRNKGKRIYLGYYKNKEDAAKVYELKAKELFGEFANIVEAE